MNPETLEKYFAFREVLLTWKIEELWDGLCQRIDGRTKHIAQCEVCSDDSDAQRAVFAKPRCRRLKALSTVIDLFADIIDLKTDLEKMYP